MNNIDGSGLDLPVADILRRWVDVPRWDVAFPGSQITVMAIGCSVIGMRITERGDVATYCEHTHEDADVAQVCAALKAEAVVREIRGAHYI